jgi:hypothetical protein
LQSNRVKNHPTQFGDVPYGPWYNLEMLVGCTKYVSTFLYVVQPPRVVPIYIFFQGRHRMKTSQDPHFLGISRWRAAQTQTTITTSNPEGHD